MASAAAVKPMDVDSDDEKDQMFYRTAESVYTVN